MKHKKTLRIKITVWLVLFATIVALFPVSRHPETAEAKVTDFNIVKVSGTRDDYTIGFNQNGDLIVTGYYYSNSSATLSYHTAYIYFHAAYSNGFPLGVTAGKRYSVYVGWHDSKPSATRPGYVEDTYYVDRNTLRKMVETLYGTEELTGQKQVYMSEGFCIKKRPSATVPWSQSHMTNRVYNSLTSIREAEEWSATTEDNFQYYFDYLLTIDLDDLFEDEDGKKRKYKLEIEEEGNGIVSGSIGEFYAGESVYEIASPDNGWYLKEWKGNKIGIEGVDWDSEHISFEMPARDVKLTAVFEKIEDGVVPVPTKAPITVTPVPTPKVTPTPPVITEAPEITPTPTPAPTPANRIDYEENYRYYTTDKGYTIGQFAKAPKLPLVTQNGVSTTVSYNLLVKNNNYSVGKDSAGNEWYFAPSGSNATYVHPKTYKGYIVDGGGIRYIQELTFPDKIICNGTTYTVTTIGGACDYYSSGSGDDRDGNGNGTYYTRDKITGKYSYNKSSSTSNPGSSFYQGIAFELSYVFGAIGNGEIISTGGISNQWSYSNGSFVERSSTFASTYEVYNTTLAEVTIPNTVTTIEPYAFANCVALTKINGGEKVREIAAYSFRNGTAEVRLSENSGTTNIRNYFYNEAQAFTGPWNPTMYEYDETRQLSEHLALAVFPSLKTIGIAAFSGRSNLHDVTLPEGVASIGENAFLNCQLNSIVVPGMNTVFNGGRETLGTKGYLPTGKTEIHSVPDSKAMLYGLDHNFYYALKCGYEVEYVNNFEPEETYLSRAELREHLVEAVEVYAPTGTTKTEDSSFLVSLDPNGDLYFRTNSNIVPQKLDFGSKVVDIERVDGQQIRGDSGKVYAYTEDGRVFGYSKYNKVSDEETPYVSEWIDIGVPKGSTSHQWATAFTVYSNSVESEYGSNWSRSAKGPIYLFYVTKEGEIQYTNQGSLSMSLGSGSYGPNGGWENPAGTVYTGSTTVQNSTKYTIPSPSGVTFKSISVAAWQGGGSDAKTEKSGYQFTNKSYYSVQKLPTIFATDTNGELWVATASLTHDQHYNRKYNASWGEWQTVSGAPINENIEKITPEHYIWKKTDIRQVWTKQSSFSAGSNNPGYSFFAIKKDGSFCYYQDMDSEPVVYLEDVKFFCRKVFFDYSFLIDENGYLWFCPDDTEITPRKLFDDAEVDRLQVSVSENSVSYDGGGGYRQVYNTFSLFDTKNRMWNFTWEYLHRSTPSVGGSYNTYETRYLTETPVITQTFPARIKKIETQMVTGSDMHFSKNKTSYGPRKESTLYLLENGEIWAYGSGVHGEDMWETSRSIGSSGYYCIIGPKGTYNTPTKVSGDIFFVDVVHKIAYSLAIDENGTVYRTGHHMEDAGDLGVTPDKYNPAEYRGFTPVETKYEYSDGNIFLAGYHFVETLYDNMFTRDGYTFLNWNLEQDNSGAPLYPEEDLVVEEPVTLYAQWEKTVNKVRYHPNGGSGHMEDSVCDPLVTRKVVLAECLFTMDGHGFVGWNTKKDGTGTMYQPGTEYNTGTKTSTTLYAQWEPLDYTLHVAQDEERVRPVTSTSHELSYNEEFTIPAAKPDRSFTVDYRLNKKSTMSTTPAWKTPTPFSDNYTKAKLKFIGWELWEEIVKNAEYNYLNRLYLPGQIDKNFARHKQYDPVLFPYWGGDTAYVDLSVAVCDGYWFVGYTTTPEETNEENVIHAEDGSGAMYKPKGDETLYAYYEPKQYEIDLVVDVEDAEPGEITLTQTEVLMTFDEQIPNVAVPQSDIYIFMGYYDKLDADGIPTADAVQYYDENGAAAIDTRTGTPMVWRIHDESVTKLYAYFISEIEVTLDGRGATKQEQKSVTMAYDQVGPDVIPPEKTGYTFHGYYTGTRGTGKQYFDANGKGSAVWLEKRTNILYAYWIQNPVELPEKDPAVNPDVLPEDRVVIEASLDKSTVHIYADDNDPTTGAMTDVQPYLVSDVVIDGKVVAEGAIPSMENVAIRAKMGAWMLSSVLGRRSGVDYVRVYVTVPYQTQYEDEETEELIISDIQYATYDFMIPKAWSYWVVADGGIYFPDKVVVENEALGEGKESLSVKWNVEGAAGKPTYRIAYYGEKSEHVIWNFNSESNRGVDTDGVPCVSVRLSSVETIVSMIPGELPDVSLHLQNVCQNAAWRDNSQFAVRSDGLMVEGVKLLEDAIFETGIGAMPNLYELENLIDRIEETTYQQTYKSGVWLRKEAKNDFYETKATIEYVASEANVGEHKKKSVSVTEANEIKIHTPVLCDPIITADNDTMYQCERIPAGSTVLVLDEEGRYSDFCLRVENIGYHSDKKGYGERDYGAYSAKRNGEVQNEVCFPFPVWLDTKNDGEKENDIRIPKGEWYLLGDREQRFYVPIDTKEGIYELSFRSVAVNGAGREENTEEYCNSETTAYVATGSVSVFLTGRLYDFTVYRVQGTTAWDEVEESDMTYTVGIQTESDNVQKTLPLRRGGHPKYRNLGGLPMGGEISFRMKSIGSSFGKGSTVTIVPYLSIRTEDEVEVVDVYYEEETERGVFLRKWEEEEQKRRITVTEDTEGAIREWQDSFRLPNELYVAKKGTDVFGIQRKEGLSFKESFWIKKEPLVLCFAITLENPQGEKLYYGMIPRKIKNNIWKTEAKDSYREDSSGNCFEILGGEVAIIYPGDSADEESAIYGIY